MEILDQSVDELPRPLVEDRLASIICRNKEAARLFQGSEDDFEQEVPRKIVRAAQLILKNKIPGGPSIANLAEHSGVPESELRSRAYEITSDMMAEFDSYAARIQAEGFKTRKMKAIEEGHARLARTNWRNVDVVSAQVGQLVNSVQLSASERGRNDVGRALARIKDQPDAVREPIPLPWGWFNTLMKGGLGPSRKLYYVGPPGSRKSTWLYNALIFWARIGEQAVHFALDGGPIEDQSVVIHTILWRQSVELWNKQNPEKRIDFYQMVDTGAGWANYPYINDQTAWDILRDRLDFHIPPMALELYWSAYNELQDLTTGGKGPGRITLVSAEECLSSFPIMRQRLESERYDGMSVWTMDNFTKGSGKYRIGLERADELVQTLHTFTDESTIPMVMLAHMSGEAIAEIQSREEGFVKYGRSAEEDCDFEFLVHYDKAKPQFLKVSLPKNRKEASGNKAVFTQFHIEPTSGMITELPE